MMRNASKASDKCLINNFPRFWCTTVCQYTCNGDVFGFLGGIWIIFGRATMKECIFVCVASGIEFHCIFEVLDTRK